MERLSINDVNHLSQSLVQDCIKDPYLKAKVDTLNTFELYKLTYKAVNQNQINESIIGFDKKTGDTVQFDPQGNAAPVIMFRAKDKEQFLKVLKQYQDKGADVVRIR